MTESPGTAARRPDGGRAPLKIGMVSPYDYGAHGGVNVHVSNLAKQLRLRGHAVKVIAPLASAAERELEPDFIPIGRPVPVPFGGSTARIAVSFWRERSVRAVLQREAFDIVHLHEPAAVWLPITILRRSNALNVGTFHAFQSNRLYPIWRFYARRYCRKLSARIAVSKPAFDFANRFLPGDYDIIPNGVDVDLFSTPLPPIERFADGKVNILFVSRLERRKGLLHLVRAYSRLKWEHPNLRLIIVGAGNPGEEVLGVIGERNLHDVEFVGGVSPQDLPRYYQTADIFCAPKHRPRELRPHPGRGYGRRQAHRRHPHRRLPARRLRRRRGIARSAEGRRRAGRSAEAPHRRPRPAPRDGRARGAPPSSSTAGSASPTRWKPSTADCPSTATAPPPRYERLSPRPRASTRSSGPSAASAAPSPAS